MVPGPGHRRRGIVQKTAEDAVRIVAERRVRRLGKAFVLRIEPVVRSCDRDAFLRELLAVDVIRLFRVVIVQKASAVEEDQDGEPLRALRQVKVQRLRIGAGGLAVCPVQDVFYDLDLVRHRLFLPFANIIAHIAPKDIFILSTFSLILI